MKLINLIIDILSMSLMTHTFFSNKLSSKIIFENIKFNKLISQEFFLFLYLELQ